MMYRADASAEFITDDDNYLVWFKCDKSFKFTRKTPSSYKIKEIIKAEKRVDFINNLVQYCLNQGAGIEYNEFNEDGTRNLTTDYEKTRKPFGKIRYVDQATIDWFLSPEILPKTKYILQQYWDPDGKFIDLCDMDEWVAICNIFKCNDISYTDALNINSCLWNYEITPLDIDITSFSAIPKVKTIMEYACEDCRDLNAKSECNCEQCPLTLMKAKAGETNNQ